MPGGAPCRAGDREAEDPETPPCEDGLSAASARGAGEPPPQAIASGFPDATLASLPDHPSTMPPHVTTPHERAPLPGGMSHVRTIYERLSRTIFKKSLSLSRNGDRCKRVFGAASRRLLALGPGSHSAFAACARESRGR